MESTLWVTAIASVGIMCTTFGASIGAIIGYYLRGCVIKRLEKIDG